MTSSCKQMGLRLSAAAPSHLRPSHAQTCRQARARARRASACCPAAAARCRSSPGAPRAAGRLRSKAVSGAERSACREAAAPHARSGMHARLPPKACIPPPSTHKSCQAPQRHTFSSLKRRSSSFSTSAHSAATAAPPAWPNSRPSSLTASRRFAASPALSSSVKCGTTGSSACGVTSWSCGGREVQWVYALSKAAVLVQAECCPNQCGQKS